MARYTLIPSPVGPNAPSATAPTPIVCDVETRSTDDASTKLRVFVNGVPVDVNVLDAGPPLLVSIDGKPIEVIEEAGTAYRVWASSAALQVVTTTNQTSGAALAANDLRAPMPGRVVKVFCKAGDVVERGAPLVVLEAMKMENELVATARARVSEVFVTEGSTVEARSTLLAFAEP